MTGGDNTEVLVAVARIEGKIDLTLAETAALKAADADHESRLRIIEATPVPDKKTADRLDALEDRRTVSPAQLWFGLVGVSGLVLTVLTIADRWSALFGG
jgi:hypothetical protein